MNAPISIYPGEAASPSEVFALAEEYRLAAQSLVKMGRPRQPLSRAPGRLCAIHAIELYLNAYLLSRGMSPQEIRTHLHDLQGRSERARASGLILRKRTNEHLTKMTEEREYLISRYGPEMATTLSEINRVMATLEEVAKKVGRKNRPEADEQAKSLAGASIV